MKLEQLSRPVRYLYVCGNGHVGEAGRKSRSDQVKTKPCFKCGEPAELKPVSPSGKTKRRKKLPDISPRDAEEFMEPDGSDLLPEPFPVDFEFTTRQLDQLENGEVPTIAFPRTEMPPLLIGHLYEATDDLDIFVTGFTETVTHLVARYEIQRAVQFVRSDAIFVERRATNVRAWRHPKNGTYHPAKPEAERLRKKEISVMSIDVHERELEKQKQDVAKADRLVKELEQDYSRDQCWGARQTVKSLEAVVESTEERIRQLQKGVRRTASAGRS